MSYILDALRKAERERRREAEPTLLTVHAAGGTGARPGGLAYAGLAVVLIGAGIAVGQWHPWQRVPLPVAHQVPVNAEPDLGRPSADLPAIARPSPEPVPSTPLAAKPEMARPMKPTVSPSRPAAPPVALAGREVVRLRAAPAESLQLPARPAAQSSIPKRELPVRKHEAAAPKSEPVASAAGISVPVKTAAVPPPDAVSGTPLQPVAPPPGKVVQFNDLPDAMRKEIPDMSIQIHTYSATPGERIVGINGRLLQEGDYLAEGLKLEQITPDGMIFSYKNHRFRRGLP